MIFVGEERFSGRVDRWLQVGARKKVEAFEMTLAGHERIGFPGWACIDTFSFVDQPKLGPARIYQRVLPLSSSAQAVAYLAGNVHEDSAILDLDGAHQSPRRITLDDLRDVTLDDEGLSYAWADSRDPTWERAMLSGLSWFVVRSVSRSEETYTEALTMLTALGGDLEAAALESADTIAWDCEQRREEVVAAELYWPRLLRPIPSMPMFVLRRYLAMDERTYRRNYYLARGDC